MSKETKQNGRTLKVIKVRENCSSSGITTIPEQDLLTKHKQAEAFLRHVLKEERTLHEEGKLPITFYRSKSSNFNLKSEVPEEPILVEQPLTEIVKNFITEVQETYDPYEKFVVSKLTDILEDFHRQSVENDAPKLECGYVVVRRDGDVCAILPSAGGLAVQDESFLRCRVSNYNANLTSNSKPAYDIMQVFGQRPGCFKFGTEGRELIWERNVHTVSEVDAERMSRLFDKAMTLLAHRLEQSTDDPENC